MQSFRKGAVVGVSILVALASDCDWNAIAGMRVEVSAGEHPHGLKREAARRLPPPACLNVVSCLKAEWEERRQAKEDVQSKLNHLRAATDKDLEPLKKKHDDLASHFSRNKALRQVIARSSRCAGVSRNRPYHVLHNLREEFAADAVFCGGPSSQDLEVGDVRALFRVVDPLSLSPRLMLSACRPRGGEGDCGFRSLRRRASGWGCRARLNGH